MPLRCFGLLLLMSVYACSNERAPIEKKAAAVPDSIVPLRGYKETIARIDSMRQDLGEELTHAKSGQQKLILLKADSLLFDALDKLYLHWKGTPWDFNGITQVPQKGSIACGYFVTTLLKHVGHPANRVRLATCASMQMMKELTGPRSVSNRSRESVEAFAGELKQHPQAVFIVGLDSHTGFILSGENEAWFLHSSYINKEGVVKESLPNSVALRSSKTRYITKLTGNEKFLRDWLLR